MEKEDKAKAATEQMFASVGRAITQWSFVEQALSNIFTVCVTPCPAKATPENGFVSFIDSPVPTAVFYSIESFRGKLGLVDAALLARVPDPESWAEEIRVLWAKLRDKARKLSLKRNRLAHWTVLPAFHGEDFLGEQEGEIFRDASLLPPYGSPGWWTETGINPLGARLKPLHVEHLHRAFCILEERLRAFMKRLALTPELSDKYDQLTVRLIRSHDRLDPSRGERIRRDLASPEKY